MCGIEKIKWRMKKYLIVLLFFLFSVSFSQTSNISNGYFVFKINGSYFKDRDGSRLKNGNSLYKPATTKCRTGQYIQLEQDLSKSAIYPGAELSYHLARSSYYGFSFGVCYSYDRTWFSYASNERISISEKQFQVKSGKGTGSLSNNMYKFSFGFNFHTSFGLSFYFQPANPELRIIKDKNSVITVETYDGFYAGPTNIYSCYRKDSIIVLSSTETEEFSFYNYRTKLNLSIAFPTLLGVEQKFKVNKINCVSGVSFAFSGLESYYVFRLYLGICFGNFKEDNQPGY